MFSSKEMGGKTPLKKKQSATLKRKNTFRKYESEEKRLLALKYPFLTPQQLKMKARQQWLNLSQNEKDNYKPCVRGFLTPGRKSFGERLSLFKSPISSIVPILRSEKTPETISEEISNPPNNLTGSDHGSPTSHKNNDTAEELSIRFATKTYSSQSKDKLHFRLPDIIVNYDGHPMKKPGILRKTGDENANQQTSKKLKGRVCFPGIPLSDDLRPRRVLCPPGTPPPPPQEETPPSSPTICRSSLRSRQNNTPTRNYLPKKCTLQFTNDFEPKASSAVHKRNIINNKEVCGRVLRSTPETPISIKKVVSTPILKTSKRARRTLSMDTNEKNALIGQLKSPQTKVQLPTNDRKKTTQHQTSSVIDIRDIPNQVNNLRSTENDILELTDQSKDKLVNDEHMLIIQESKVNTKENRNVDVFNFPEEERDSFISFSHPEKTNVKLQENVMVVSKTAESTDCNSKDTKEKKGNIVGGPDVYEFKESTQEKEELEIKDQEDVTEIQVIHAEDNLKAVQEWCEKHQEIIMGGTYDKGEDSLDESEHDEHSPIQMYDELQEDRGRGGINTINNKKESENCGESKDIDTPPFMSQKYDFTRDKEFTSMKKPVLRTYQNNSRKRSLVRGTLTYRTKEIVSNLFDEVLATDTTVAEQVSEKKLQHSRVDMSEELIKSFPSASPSPRLSRLKEKFNKNNERLKKKENPVTDTRVKQRTTKGCRPKQVKKNQENLAETYDDRSSGSEDLKENLIYRFNDEYDTDEERDHGEDTNVLLTNKENENLIISESLSKSGLDENHKLDKFHYSAAEEKGGNKKNMNTFHEESLTTANHGHILKDRCKQTYNQENKKLEYTPVKVGFPQTTTKETHCKDTSRSTPQHTGGLDSLKSEAANTTTPNMPNSLISETLQKAAQKPHKLYPKEAELPPYPEMVLYKGAVTEMEGLGNPETAKMNMQKLGFGELSHERKPKRTSRIIQRDMLVQTEPCTLTATNVKQSHRENSVDKQKWQSKNDDCLTTVTNRMDYEEKTSTYCQVRRSPRIASQNKNDSRMKTQRNSNKPCSISSQQKANHLSQGSTKSIPSHLRSPRFHVSNLKPAYFCDHSFTSPDTDSEGNHLERVSGKDIVSDGLRSMRQAATPRQCAVIPDIMTSPSLLSPAFSGISQLTDFSEKSEDLQSLGFSMPDECVELPSRTAVKENPLLQCCPTACSPQQILPQRKSNESKQDATIENQEKERSISTLKNQTKKHSPHRKDSSGYKKQSPAKSNLLDQGGDSKCAQGETDRNGGTCLSQASSKSTAPSVGTGFLENFFQDLTPPDKKRQKTSNRRLIASAPKKKSETFISFLQDNDIFY